MKSTELVGTGKLITNEDSDKEMVENEVGIPEDYKDQKMVELEAFLQSFTSTNQAFMHPLDVLLFLIPPNQGSF